jgi:polyribonucleotide nucleotidyltransferase
VSNLQSFQCRVGGRDFVIETGRLASQASGAVTVRYGDTVVLVTATVSDEPREGVDFLPLTIDYEERLYAAGKIPGGFIRREGRPSEAAILACRLVDRPIRPLLPKEWRRDIQVVATVLSVDHENDPDVMAVIGASAAMCISEIPFAGPLSAVHVGYINGELVLNPTLAELENSQLDLVVASTREAIVMLEASAKEVSEDILPGAIQFGFEANQEIIRLQEQVQQACGKPKLEAPVSELNSEVISVVASAIGDEVAVVLAEADKSIREEKFARLKAKLVEDLGETYAEEDILAAFEARAKAEVRNGALAGKRLNGRALDEVRAISAEVGLLPRTHGSALFSRGQTQVLTIATLGSTRQEQQLDGLGIEEAKRFIHHYNFPPFSSGEVKRMGSPGRREIGHGALAERALVPVLPADEDFPYTIRLVSEVLSSSGSTSMASVCAGSLSLMDAGIPIKTAVSGVAMGLVTGDKGEYQVLTDIEGLEDAYGDMDFKIAGTRDGVTAVQMDIKLKGVSLEILEKIIAQSHPARMGILDKMNEAISTNRPEVSKYAPRVYKLTIDQEKIGSVIGTGGKTIRSIIEQTKTTIDIDDEGVVLIGATSEEAAQKAIAIIEGLTKEVEIGTIYTGKVTRIFDFGAMVEILPGKEGLVHISELDDHRVGKVEDVVNIGDEVTVKAINIDNMGRVNLSRRAVFEKDYKPSGAQARDSSGSRRPFRRDNDSYSRRSGPPRRRPPLTKGTFRGR